MYIGIFSDIHDRLDHLERALDAFSERGAGALLFCGDFCSPFTAGAMGRFEGPIHAVFGNNDGDRFTIGRVAQAEAPGLTLHGEHAELVLDGVALALTHYPLYGRALATTGDYRAVFSGHTHARHQEQIGACLWLNPGEVMGWKGPPTCALYDTRTHTAETLFL
jgi:putative phosphoesterase